jgi:hypothetical protein
MIGLRFIKLQANAKLESTDPLFVLAEVCFVRVN